MNWTQEDLNRIQGNRAAIKQGPPKARKGREPGTVANTARLAQPATRIGIDPAFRKNGMGVCVISPDNEVTFPRFKGRGLVAFVKWLKTAPDNVLVTIEDSNLQNATFNNSGTKAKSNRVSRNVGCNQAASAYIVDFCIDRWGHKVVRAISAQKKGGK